MIAAHSVADVRAAEHALMAQVPDGALMQRAATGLAVVCMRLLGRTTGSRVVLLVGGGDNGGDTLFAGARLAARGARVRAVLLDEAKAHAAGLAALRAAGGRVVTGETAADEIAAADLVLDGIVGIGGKP
ncbi:MAG: NAD(P)H-hydrate epimerase, partial [Jiangellales bacterium]